MRLRTKAREIALALLYQVELSHVDYNLAFQNYLKNYPQNQKIADFSILLLEGVLNNIDSIDSLIKEYAQNWDIGRMAVVDRNILRIASLELIFLKDIPPKVSINEAIEIAKRFGDIDSPRFVNGVLDKMYKMQTKRIHNKT